jgi:hypothetical protein
MIVLAFLLAAQIAQGVTPEGQARINQNAVQGPPDFYLQNEIYDITGQHLCDRNLSDQWQDGFNKLYGRRLELLHRKLVAIFGEGAMARDIIRITSCLTFVGESVDAHRERQDTYLRRRAAFSEDLAAWEEFAVNHSRN